MSEPHGLPHQTPLYMGFSRQEYWSGLPFPPGNLPNPGIKPMSPASPVLAGGFFTSEPPGKPIYTYIHTHTMMEYCSIIKNENSPFATTWVDLEGIMLSVRSQRKTNTLYVITYMWNLKKRGCMYTYSSLGEGNGCLLQYSCLENPLDRWAWQATVHGVTKNQTQLRN